MQREVFPWRNWQGWAGCLSLWQLPYQPSGLSCLPAAPFEPEGLIHSRIWGKQEGAAKSRFPSQAVCDCPGSGTVSAPFHFSLTQACTRNTQARPSVRSLCLLRHSTARGLVLEQLAGCLCSKGGLVPKGSPWTGFRPPSMRPASSHPSFERGAGSPSNMQVDAFHSDEQQQSWDCLSFGFFCLVMVVELSLSAVYLSLSEPSLMVTANWPWNWSWIRIWITGVVCMNDNEN